MAPFPSHVIALSIVRLSNMGDIHRPRIASVVNCNTRHAGQIEYLRGLIKHEGWFPAAER